MQQCPLCHQTEACDECTTLGAFCFGAAQEVTPEQVDAFHAVLDRRGKPLPEEDDIVAFVNDVRRAYNAVIRRTP